MLDVNKIGLEILEVVKKENSIKHQIEKKTNDTFFAISENDIKKIINICLKIIFGYGVRFNASSRVKYSEISSGKDVKKQKEEMLKKISEDIAKKTLNFLEVEESLNDLRKEVDLNFTFSFIPLKK